MEVRYLCFLCLMLLGFTRLTIAQANKKLKVVSALSKPYLMKSNSSTGKPETYGYVVDVLNALAEVVPFEYELTISDVYGNFNPEKKTWEGMIGDVVNKEVDMAFADITMTYERLQVVDFSYPYQSFVLSVLTKKKEYPGDSSSIFSPFTIEVWIYIMVMCAVYAVMLFAIGRISIKDWRVINGERQSLKNEFGLWNSFWFVSSSVFFRSTHSTPKGVAVRVLYICFFFFTAMITYLFIAGLTAYISVPPRSTLPSTVEDLLDENKHFGAIKGGSTHFFLKNSANRLHQDVHANIAGKHLFENKDDIVKAVKKDPNLAVVVESPMMEYLTARHCDLHGVKFTDSPRHFSIALPFDSPIIKKISGGILKLQFSGKLTQIYNKWWNEKMGGGGCAPVKGSGDKEANFPVTAITLHDIRSLCMFFGSAVIVCIVLAIVEFLIRSAYRNPRGKSGFLTNVRTQLRQMCTCHDRIPNARVDGEEHEGINIDNV